MSAKSVYFLARVFAAAQAHILEPAAEAVADEMLAEHGEEIAAALDREDFDLTVKGPTH